MFSFVHVREKVIDNKQYPVPLQYANVENKFQV